MGYILWKNRISKRVFIERVFGVSDPWLRHIIDLRYGQMIANMYAHRIKDECNEYERLLSSVTYEWKKFERFF